MNDDKFIWFLAVILFLAAFSATVIAWGG